MAFPTHFLDSAGKLWRIVDRMPYVLTGQWDAIAANTNNIEPTSQNAFIHSITPPFEIHDILPRAVQLTGGAGTAPIADPAPNMNALWRLSCQAVQKGDWNLFSAAVVVDSLVDREQGIWHLSGPLGDSPVYLETKQGFRFRADNTIAAGGNQIRVNVSLRGFVLSLEEVRGDGSAGMLKVAAGATVATTGRTVGQPVENVGPYGLPRGRPAI